MVTVEDVKKGLGITGEYMDATLGLYLEEVLAFCEDAGIQREKVTAGLAVRGVADLWNYGAGTGEFSEYFLQRAAQLSFRR